MTKSRYALPLLTMSIIQSKTTICGKNQNSVICKQEKEKKIAEIIELAAKDF